jgi:hypothetical protein
MQTHRSCVELFRFAGGWPLRFQCRCLIRTSADYCLRRIVSYVHFSELVERLPEWCRLCRPAGSGTGSMGRVAGRSVRRFRGCRAAWAQQLIARPSGESRDVAESDLRVGRWSWSGIHHPSGRDRFPGTAAGVLPGTVRAVQDLTPARGMLRRHQAQWSFTVRAAQAHAGLVRVRFRTEVGVGVRRGRGFRVALWQ